MLSQQDKEIWVEINEENLHQDENYQLSNFGRIKSFKVFKNEGKIIKGSWVGGYNCIFSKLNSGKSKTFYVHKLVAMYFLKKDKEDQNAVIHLDFDISNNHFYNLKWANNNEMRKHRHLDPNYNKKKIRNSKLTENEIVRIKTILKSKVLKPYRIAQQFGISQTQLARISSGKNWSHIKID
ncbi:MAG: hypothetical protein AUJ98_11535 [Bacteroidetes bacterium CG2_30_33_31]|nr:MAG: hypothetical protein AUJ98_11535 [Bacteroidetes bacterium CG2_30_33_31]